MSNSNDSSNTTVFQVPKIASNCLEFDNGYTLKYGSNTDIGGNLYNQDASCVVHFRSETFNKSGSAFCIADGHGKEGELAAKVSTKRLEELIKEGVDELVENPVAFLEFAFKDIQEEIKSKLIEKLTQAEYEVEKFETNFDKARLDPKNLKAPINYKRGTEKKFKER